MKICKNDALKVMDLYSKGESAKNISKIFNVNKSTILRILKSERKVDGDSNNLIAKKRIDFYHPNQKLSKAQIEEVKEMRKNGFKVREILKYYNCSKSTIHRACKY